jgi:hypothetical protein
MSKSVDGGVLRAGGPSRSFGDSERKDPREARDRLPPSSRDPDSRDPRKRINPPPAPRREESTRW